MIGEAPKAKRGYLNSVGTTAHVPTKDEMIKTLASILVEKAAVDQKVSQDKNQQVLVKLSNPGRADLIATGMLT